MRILLLGATGVVGRRLGPRLRADGHDVVGTTRQPARAPALAATGVTPLLLDVVDPAAVDLAVADVAPDAVVHQLTDLAAGDTTANARLRVVGTRHLVDAAQRHGVRTVVAQSISWAYAPGRNPATEADPLDHAATGARGVTVDGVARLEAAVSEMAHGVVLRYGALYGPDTWYARDGVVAARVQQGEVAAGDDITCFLHIDDAVEAAVAALRWPPGAVNIVDDAPATSRDWLTTYAAALGAPAPPTSDERSTRTRAVSNARATTLGWRPTHASWRDTALGLHAATD
jgi:nucleoside-diphosphate-sugar epimerase